MHEINEINNMVHLLLSSFKVASKPKAAENAKSHSVLLALFGDGTIHKIWYITEK